MGYKLSQAICFHIKPNRHKKFEFYDGINQKLGKKTKDKKTIKKSEYKKLLLFSD